MTRFAFAILFAVAICSHSVRGDTIVVVVGAAGEPEYGKMFREWAQRWQDAGKKAGAQVLTVGLDQRDKKKEDHDKLKTVLTGLTSDGDEPLWIVVIGHGTFNRKMAKINLRGPDVTATELTEWIDRFERPLALVNCTSASSPFINQSSRPNRVVVTATKSGFQYNFARFGQYVSAAIGDIKADLDKDQQVSLLEAFLYASAKVQEYYRDKSQLATENALLDDNGDGLGTPADWFRGVRAIKRAKEGAQIDGLRANQMHLIRSPAEQRIPPAVRTKRDEIELEISALRERKTQIHEDEYYPRLERLMLRLARLYASVEKAEKEKKAAKKPATKKTASQ